MKILVTGATGKVGSRLSNRLAQRGDRVRALARDRARATELAGDGIELAKGDLLCQVNEVLAKVLCYNLTVLVHEMFELGIRPEFLPVAV